MIGLAVRERYSREIIKSSAIAEFGWAVIIAVIIHLCAWGLLYLSGYDLAGDLKQFADYQSIPTWLLVDHLVRRIPWFLGYTVITAMIGLVVGCLFSALINSGKLQVLATHKWINHVSQSMRGGIVTAYVMTTIKENNRVLMYKGILAEFYLSPDGKFIYVVLKRCSRYFMSFDESVPKTSDQLQLFGATQDDRHEQLWDYLLIDGASVANILFDPSPQIQTTDVGGRELDEAVRSVSSDS